MNRMLACVILVPSLYLAFSEDFAVGVMGVVIAGAIFIRTVF